MSYREIVAQFGATFKPRGLKPPPALRLLATQEELAALFARALEVELRRGKHKKGTTQNRAFGEKKEYSYSQVSKQLLDQHNGIVGAKVEPLTEGPKFERPEVNLRINTPRSYFAQYATLSKLEIEGGIEHDGNVRGKENHVTEDPTEDGIEDGMATDGGS